MNQSAAGNPLIHLMDGSGRFTPCDGIPATDRGFRYGMQLFETIGVRNGKAQFVRDHLDLLKRFAVDFTLPRGWSDACADHIATLPITNGVVRVYVTGGDGSPMDPVKSPRILTVAEEMPTTADEARHCITIAPPVLPQPAKSGGYWPHIAACSEARRRGADDALLVTGCGNLISGSMANVFVIVGSKLMTPALSTGARPGIIRQWILERFPTEEVAFPAERLAVIDSAFLTNSRILICPIASIDGRELQTSALTSQISSALLAEVDGTDSAG